MHGTSLEDSVVMGYQGMRHFFARREMIGVGVLVVIGRSASCAGACEADSHEPSWGVRTRQR